MDSNLNECRVVVRDGLGLGFIHTNRHTRFQIIVSVLKKRVDVVVPELHEQMLCVVGFHSMIVGQLEVSVNVSFDPFFVFRATRHPHSHHFVAILNAPPNATGLDSPLVEAAQPHSEWVKKDFT